jgi:hypothetical protein
MKTSHAPAPRRVLIAAACGLVAVACAAVAAEAQQPAGPTPPPRVEERKPELFYLENDSGGLVPVPGFRYRDFVELLRLKEGLPGPAQPPAVVLEEIRVQADLTAVADGTCPATVVCTIRQARRGWVEVPLGCAGLILTRPPRHEGPGRLLVDAAPEGRGYRAWLDAAPEPGQEPRHTVTLEGRIPVDAPRAREAIVLHMPTATASAVEIRSPRTDPEVVVQPPPAERKVRPRDAGGAEVTLSGVVGTTTISVGDRTAADSGRAPVADAFVESVVRIDGRDAVTQARIRLGGLAEAATTVRISLPPATTMRNVRAPSAVVGRAGTVDAPTVDVAVVRGADGEAVVELECQRPLERNANGKEAGPFELAGFAVEGIERWRQWGRISLVVEGEWQAVWNEGLRRVDPPAAGRRPGLVAAFAYDTQPASLKVRVLPRRSRVVIEPEYRYEVAAERVALYARLGVAASGAPATEIVVDIDPAWVIDEVGPATVVDAAGVTVEGGRIRIPFAQPLVGNAVVEIRGGRPVERGAERLAWRLPVPSSGLIGPATVVVGADSDIELLPDNERIKGLVRQTAAALSGTDIDAVVLAYRLDARQGEFAATRRYLPRRVDATVAVQAVMDEAATVVTETLRLRVLHVPLESVELLVPASVAAGGSLEVRQGDWVLDPVEVAEAPAAGASEGPAADGPGGMRRLRAILPGQLLGVGEVVVQYALPTPAVPPETTVAHDLPLVLPTAARVTRQTVALDAPERWSVEVRGDAWRRDPSPQPTAVSRSWSTIRQQESVPLAIAVRRGATSGNIVVDAALLRTTVLGDRRDDVFTYVLSGAAERLDLTLPPGDAEIRLDGHAVVAASRADGGVAIDLPRSDAGRRLLEIRRLTRSEGTWDRLAARFGLPVRVPLDPPRFAADVVERRFYWELDARADEWLFGLPASWTSQQQWRWGGLVPERTAVVSRQALASWVQAAAAANEPPRDSVEPEPLGSRVVYAGVGWPGPAAPWLLPLWFLVLVCSGTVLTVGMACLANAALRRPAPLLALAAAAVLAAAAAPDAAALAAVAAVPGALLFALAWALQRLGGTAPSRRNAAAVPMSSASSLTRAAAPSLIISGSAVRGDSVTTARRPSS